MSVYLAFAFLKFSKDKKFGPKGKKVKRNFKTFKTQHPNLI